MTNICHTCERPYEVSEATSEHPYHYTESGLTNWWLVGIPVYSCANCGIESAEIPDMDGLHNLISKNIILTPFSMTGQELTFLRKETRLRLKEFAERLGVDPKTVKNWESSEKLSKAVDITVRILVASCVWKGNERLEVLAQIADLVQFGEGEFLDQLEQDIAELAKANVEAGIPNQQWGIAA
jgi:DNA-binding transcriptional regulator YiaG